MAKNVHLVVEVDGTGVVYPLASTADKKPYVSVEEDISGMLYRAWKWGGVLYSKTGEEVTDVTQKQLDDALLNHPANKDQKNFVTATLAEASAALPDAIKEGLVK